MNRLKSNWFVDELSEYDWKYLNLLFMGMLLHDHAGDWSYVFISLLLLLATADILYKKVKGDSS